MVDTSCVERRTQAVDRRRSWPDLNWNAPSARDLLNIQQRIATINKELQDLCSPAVSRPNSPRKIPSKGDEDLLFEEDAEAQCSPDDMKTELSRSERNDIALALRAQLDKLQRELAGALHTTCEIGAGMQDPSRCESALPVHAESQQHRNAAVDCAAATSSDSEQQKLLDCNFAEDTDAPYSKACEDYVNIQQCDINLFKSFDMPVVHDIHSGLHDDCDVPAPSPLTCRNCRHSGTASVEGPFSNMGTADFDMSSLAAASNNLMISGRAEEKYLVRALPSVPPRQPPLADVGARVERSLPSQSERTRAALIEDMNRSLASARHHISLSPSRVRSECTPPPLRCRSLEAAPSLSSVSARSKNTVSSDFIATVAPGGSQRVRSCQSRLCYSSTSHSSSAAVNSAAGSLRTDCGPSNLRNSHSGELVQKAACIVESYGSSTVTSGGAQRVRSCQLRLCTSTRSLSSSTAAVNSAAGSLRTDYGSSHLRHSQSREPMPKQGYIAQSHGSLLVNSGSAQNLRSYQLPSCYSSRSLSSSVVVTSAAGSLRTDSSSLHLRNSQSGKLACIAQPHWSSIVVPQGLPFASKNIASERSASCGTAKPCVRHVLTPRYRSAVAGKESPSTSRLSMPVTVRSPRGVQSVPSPFYTSSDAVQLPTSAQSCPIPQKEVSLAPQRCALTSDKGSKILAKVVVTTPRSRRVIST